MRNRIERKAEGICRRRVPEEREQGMFCTMRFVL